MNAKDELIAARREYVDHLHKCSMVLASVAGQIRTKPLLGGAFGHGGFLLASRSGVTAGLDQVDYFVFDADSRFMLGWGESKHAAIKMARGMLDFLGPSGLRRECEAHAASMQSERNRLMVERAAALAERRADAPTATVRSIPRRRKQIYDESKGQCHYCGTALTLDGRWHIEHKMPKALGGGNEPGNLVASCIRCNHRKRDRTDIEFKAELLKGSAT
jgi:5-methylcytosine-specific restriction endonuclease McrA